MKSLIKTIKIIFDELVKPRQPIPIDKLGQHLDAAADWMMQAQQATGDGGLAASYNLFTGGWTSAYPETTGYAIPTLLAYAQLFDRKDARRAALEMADFELRVQDDSGGFPALRERPGDPYKLVAFDTGQVVLGLLAAYNETGKDEFATAAQKACDWLVTQQTAEGWWEDYTGYRSSTTIDARVAYALVVAAKISGESKYSKAAIKQLDWTLGQQNPSGWVANSTFKPGKPSILHTLAYVAEGFLEAGLLLGHEQYINAARRIAKALAVQQRTDGFLPGAFDIDWQPAASWSCITGQSQIALVWLHLAEVDGDPLLIDAAVKSLCFTAASQRLVERDPGIRGGLPGSRPIYGRYLPLRYPNWAAKFFMDATMAILGHEKLKK